MGSDLSWVPDHLDGRKPVRRPIKIWDENTDKVLHQVGTSLEEIKEDEVYLKATVPKKALFFEIFLQQVSYSYPFIPPCIPPLYSIFIIIGALEHFQKNIYMEKKKTKI